MSRKTNRDAFAKLDALYARLPTIACRRLCGVACGAIPLSTLEADRLRRATHRAPTATPDNACVYLTPQKTCSAYAARPLICRVYGLVKRMSCPHGCTPSRWLTDREFLELGAAVERIGGGMIVLTDNGSEPLGDSFVQLARGVAIRNAQGDGMPDDVAEHYATLTHGLRALHGGRIIAALPTPAGQDARTIDVDELQRQRKRDRRKPPNGKE